MRWAAALLALVLLATGPARAALAPADLDAVRLAPAPGARLPIATPFVDQTGAALRLGDLLGHRPTVLVLADYDCRELCGPILAVVAGALAGTGFAAGRDYDLVAVGLNPRATPADAARMGAAQLGPLATAAHLLSGTPDAVAVVERALGYHAVSDPESGRYAHPADVLVLTADGRVSRVLPGLALDPGTLRLALVEAGQGRIGTLGDRLHLLCYGLDPAHGAANRIVGIVLTAGGALTLAGLGLFVFGLVRRASAPGSRVSLYAVIASGAWRSSSEAPHGLPRRSAPRNDAGRRLARTPPAGRP